MQIQNVSLLKSINFSGHFFRETRFDEPKEIQMPVDTFAHKPAITMEEANKIYNAMMEINAPLNFNLPEFSARKQFLGTGEIINFHDDIAKKNNGDDISYWFYTTKNDIGSGLTIMKLPIEVAKDDKTKSEMLKEIKRLLSDGSKLSPEQKEKLMFLYRDYLK